MPGCMITWIHEMNEWKKGWQRWWFNDILTELMIYWKDDRDDDLMKGWQRWWFNERMTEMMI